MTNSPVSGPLPTPLQSNPSPSASSSSSNTNHAHAPVVAQGSTPSTPGTISGTAGTAAAAGSTMNMTDMRSALPGIQQQQQQQHQHQQHQHQQHQQPAFEPPKPYFYPQQMPQHMPQHMPSQYAIPQPGMFYPVYPQYFPHQPPYPGFSPAYMQPPSPSHPVPLFGHQPAGYGPGYMPAPYPMLAGQNPAYLSPQGFVPPGQYAKLSTRLRPDSTTRRDSPKSAASHEKPMTIVDGSSSMKSSDSRSEISPPPSLPPASSNAVPGAPRRTPKQSGHALWVGNLPPGTSIVDLKDHFSQGVSPDIESVFLISKSNCAFINYKTEDVCSAAQARFHDSRFQSVRLVCRLRRGVVPNGAGGSTSVSSSGSSPAKNEGFDTPSKTSEKSETVDSSEDHSLAPPERLPNRYFVVKSLTIEDLESSRHSGIWATQTHNEVTLNRAYDTADNVYLIFSANKSGEYYGYARMVSPIQEDEKLAMEMPARTNQFSTPASKPSEPNVTPTPATATARSGRIIDDPARGTIFWEVDASDEDEDEGLSTSRVDGDVVNENEHEGDSSTADTTQHQTIGRPFRIQWLSTERVPFHRTRGLRNPWNANRGVKIARDGTEIEPTVGAQVVELFHLPTPPTTSTVGYRLSH